jgi:hypothetical protein
MSTTKLRLRCSHDVYNLSGLSALRPALRCAVCGKQTLFPFLKSRAVSSRAHLTRQTQLPSVSQSTVTPPSPRQGMMQYPPAQRPSPQPQVHSQQTAPMTAPPRHLTGWVGRSSQIVNFWEYCHFVGLLGVKLGLTYVLAGVSPIITYVLLFFSAGSGLRVAWKMLEVHYRTYRMIYRDGPGFDQSRGPLLEIQWGVLRRRSVVREASRTSHTDVDRPVIYRLLGRVVGNVTHHLQSPERGEGEEILTLFALPGSERYKEAFSKDIAPYRRIIYH